MFGKRSRIGLEITDKRLRFVEIQCSSKGNCILKAVDVPRTAKGKGAEGLTASGEELRKLLSSSGVKASEAVVVYDLHPVSITTIPIDDAATETISESANWYAEQYSPIPVDKSVVNLRVCEGSEDNSNAAVLVATDKAKVTEVLDILSAARMRVKRIDIVPFAIERLFKARENQKNGKHFAVVGLREGNVCAIIWNEKTPDYFRYFRLFPDTSAEALTMRIKHTMQSYCDWHPLNPVERIYFYRFARTFPGIEEQLQTSTNIEVCPLDPLESVDVSGGVSIDGLNSLSHLVGAAL